MKGINNIASYREIRLAKRYEDGVMLEVAFKRLGMEFAYFIGGEYHGKHNLSTAYRLLREAYGVGYKTVSKVVN